MPWLKLLIFCSIFATLYGEDLPNVQEPYSVRVPAELITPREHTGLAKEWESIKQGHLESVAQLLEMYPGQEIYFLARDGELLYDFAKIATKLFT